MLAAVLSIMAVMSDLAMLEVKGSDGRLRAVSTHSRRCCRLNYRKIDMSVIGRVG